MKRECFLCNGQTEEVLNEQWDLPDIKAHNIVFSICKGCGLILQTETLDKDEMNKYYANTASYMNPGRNGRPSDEKIYAVERHLQCVKEVIKEFPKKVFQVGCSDGYTLSQFKNNGSDIVHGIDPSYSSNEISKRIYNIDSKIGVFEEYYTQEKYNLIILTHVLEHLYDPIKILHKCNEMQNEGDFILIEVPLLERQDRFPHGMFALEHINYFSEKTIINLIYQCGYNPYMIKKSYYVDKYPVITIMAKKEKVNKNVDSDYLRVKQLLSEYINEEQQEWYNIEERIIKQIPLNSKIYIWGAGIHTSQLLAHTNIKKKYQVIALLDSSSTKWGINFGEYKCYKLNDIVLNSGDIILISSYASENEIYNSLLEYKKCALKIHKIYGDD